MSSSTDPDGADTFAAEDVEDEAPFRKEHPVGEKAAGRGQGYAGHGNDHPLEGGQTKLWTSAQDESREDTPETDEGATMSAESARPGGGEQGLVADQG